MSLTTKADSVGARVDEPIVVAPPPPPGSGARTRRLLSCAAAGVAAGAVAALVVRRGYADELTGPTDIVGYPAFENFNVRIYAVNYFLLVVVFPVVAIATFALLTAVSGRGKRRSRPRLWPAPAPEEPPAEPEATWPALLGRVAFVGAVFAAGAAVLDEAASGWLGALLVPVVLAYVGGVALVGGLAARAWGVTPRHSVAALNALLTPLVLLVLVAASESTEVTVGSTGEVTHHGWLPGIPVALVVVTSVLLVARRLRHLAPERWPGLERWMVLLVAGPVAIWVVTSGLPQVVGHFDVFHEGEALASSHLVEQGAFPWRDILFIHGLLGDVFIGWAGTAIFGDSRWGLLAGEAVVLTPLYWVGSYFLCVYLFRRNWMLLVASQAVLVLGVFTTTHLRFVLLPYVLLLLAALLRRATWPRAAGLTLLAVVQAVVTPEASSFSVAALGVVALYELTHFAPGTALAVGFGRTQRCAVTGAVATAAWLLFLAWRDALDPFFDYYRTFVGDHDLAGGVPLGHDDGDAFWVVAPVVLILAAWAFAAYRVTSRRWLTIPDWVVGSSIVALVPYYTKFLSRADEHHLGQVAAPTLVALMYAVYRLVDSVDGRWAGRLGVVRHPASAVALAAVVLLAPLTPNEALRGIPRQWSEGADSRSSLATVGYQDEHRLDPAVVADLDVVLDAYLGDDGRLFDFTNSPAVFGFMLDHELATRYFHVSMAIPEAIQRDVVAELQREQPELVVYSSELYGMYVWDGIPNAVRHYLVSDYLLDHYVPVLQIQGYTIMRRPDIPAVPVSKLASRLEGGIVTEDLYFRTQSCDWGYVPEFFALEPTETGAVSLEVWPGRDRSFVGLPDGAERFDWMEIETAEPLGDDQVTVTDETGGLARTIRFETLPGDERRARVRVGSCGQWFGYEDTLTIRTSEGAEITGVRLLEPATP